MSSLCFLRFDLPLPNFCDYIANIEMGHLAHLGSQSENRIRFTLPTGTAMKSGVPLRPMQENLETVAARTGRYLLFALAGGSLMEISRLFCELYWPLSDDGWRLGPVELTCHSYFL